MILNHKAAIEMLVDNVEQVGFDRYAIVRDDTPIDDAPVRALAAPLVAPDDLDDFIAMAIGELSGLHEGNLARYRLRPSEFHRWRGRRRESPSS